MTLFPFAIFFIFVHPRITRIYRGAVLHAPLALSRVLASGWCSPSMLPVGHMHVRRCPLLLSHRGVEGRIGCSATERSIAIPLADVWMNTSHIHAAFGLSSPRKKNKDDYLTEKDVLRYVKPFFLAKIEIRGNVVYVLMNTTLSFKL